MVVLLHLADRSFANGNNLQIYETTTLEGGKIRPWHERLHFDIFGYFVEGQNNILQYFQQKIDDRIFWVHKKVEIVGT